MSKMDEMIIVAPRAVVFNNEQWTFQGLETRQEIVGNVVKAITATREVMRRGDAEENPSYKQPIPYAVVRKGNKIFGYKRLAGGGETRLHDKISIGVGGHMNPIEGAETLAEILETNLVREINEELIITANHVRMKSVGLVNDDESEVGKVHIGILIVVDVEEDAIVEVRETEQLEGIWFTKEELENAENFALLEAWSQYVVELL